MAGYILAVDQGTTSSRAILFDDRMQVRSIARAKFDQIYPRPGWVEHDPEQIWESVLSACRAAISRSGVHPGAIAAIGIANQRETTLVWDRKSGKPLQNAIVWQDRRTAEACRRLAQENVEPLFTARTGLLLDPYFSGTKLSWLLDRYDARSRAERGELLFGTVDTYLIWRLTGGKVHATDATNASRTLLYDIHRGRWERELLEILRIPAAMLPEVKDCAADYGTCEAQLFGARTRILGVAGDQQAAMIGQACFRPGMMKSTYGTGAFALLHTGVEPVRSQARLLTTLAYSLDGRREYALEGSIFIAGAALDWLRDPMGLILHPSDADALAARAEAEQNVYFIPSFVGLGAPWWDADARGALLGLTRGTGAPEIAKAVLESIAFQTADLLDAMRQDWSGRERETVLRVDGGVVASDWTMQFLADILDAPVDRPAILETTALGAAWLAGSRAGVWPDRDGFSRSWVLERQFAPVMDAALREAKLSGWREAVRRTLSTGASG